MMLEARGLCHTYSIVPVLREVDLTIRPGEIVGYLGANGAGKTTTVRILTGLLAPSRGQVFFEGRDVDDDPLAYRSRLGYIPEAADIYPFLTGEEYLVLVGRLRALPERPLRARVASLLELLGLRAAQHVAVATYSKGMRQKLLIAAALLHNPDVLIFDEPLSGLDVTTVLTMKSLMRRLAEGGRMILYCSHLLDIVERLCTRVVVLHRGRVVADDSVANLRELMRRPSLEEAFSALVIEEDTDRTAAGILEAVDAPLA
jgi:ABC-2 type transport system ATP-binding protein